MESQTVGLIAGSGVLPLRFAESARRAGHRVVGVAHEGETDPFIRSHCDELSWVHVGQVGKILRAFRKEGVKQAVMLGALQKVKIYGGLRLDLTGLKLASRVWSMGSDAVLRVIAELFEEEGIEIVDPLVFCPDLWMQEKVYTREPTEKEWEDIRLGLEAARILGKADVGQTVCVKGKAIVAVEAIEGTDDCIRRAGQYAGKGVVVVKTANPNQDMRFDVPCVGPVTIEVMKSIEGAVLAVEADRALLLDEEETVAAARRAGIALIGLR